MTDQFDHQPGLRPVVEIVPAHHILAVDLEIDIVKAPINDNPRIIDQHLLKKAVQRGFITEEMADQFRSKAQAICDELMITNDTSLDSM